MNWLQPLAFVQQTAPKKPRSYVRRMQRYKKKVRNSPVVYRKNGLPDTGRKVIVDGREFRTISEASRQLGVSTTRIYAMEEEWKATIL